MTLEELRKLRDDLDHGFLTGCCSGDCQLCGAGRSCFKPGCDGQDCVGIHGCDCKEKLLAAVNAAETLAMLEELKEAAPYLGFSFRIDWSHEPRIVGVSLYGNHRMGHGATFAEAIRAARAAWKERG